MSNMPTVPDLRCWKPSRPSKPLAGDELGANIPDALARQQVLQAVPVEPIPWSTVDVDLPLNRLARLLKELEASGEVEFDAMGRTIRLTPPPVVAAEISLSPFLECDMARKRKSAPAVEEVQIPLIDVEHPMSKPFKALKKKIDKNDDEASALREEAQGLRYAMIDLFKAHNIAADSDGVRRVEIDGKIIEIAPGEAKLKFRNKPKPKVAAEDEENLGEDVDPTD